MEMGRGVTADEQYILSNLEQDNDFFKKALDMVPAAFYFDKDAKDKLTQNAKCSAPAEGKTSHKRPGHELSDRARAKRAKYDPEQLRTVTKVQEFLINEEQFTSKKNKKKNKSCRTIEELKSTVDNVEDLRERLQAKIELMREKRIRSGKLDVLERKKLKRRESKLKLKMRREEEKKNKKDGSHKGIVQNGGVRPKEASPPPGKPIFNKEGKMVYSKFDFSDIPGKEKKEDGLGPKKNYKKLLEKVEKERSDLKKLKESDIDAAHSVARKSAWKKALQKAEGVKVRDDPELLKKTIKKREKLKKKSDKEWGERKQKVEKRIQEKQEKRKKNIKARKQKKVDSKIKKAKKKGRILPGF